MCSTKVLQLKASFSLSSLTEESEIAALDIGPDGVTYLVLAKCERALTAAFRAKHRDYRIIGVDGDATTLDIELKTERFHIDHVQPLPEGLLLASSRAAFRNTGADKNGRVYSPSGEQKREILLGDGISSLQTTPKGRIWTGYFDEGVYGNSGWDPPLGASGLVAWDAQGQKTFEFQPIAVPTIDDCNALNVASEDDVWLCYYSDFPLVHLRNDRIVAVWRMPLESCRAFAVDDRHSLFAVGRGGALTLRLFEIREQETPRLLADFKLEDPSGRPLETSHVSARAKVIRFLSLGSLFEIDVQTALKAMKEKPIH